jgi:hypothetical protein
MPPEERGVGNPAALAISLSIRASTLVACGPRRPQAVWRTLNNGMPLVLVQDMALVPLRDGAGNIVDRLIHAATFGRGVFEVSLTGTPGVRLLLRATVIDDGRPLEGAAALAFDPRLRRAAAPQQVPFEFQHGYDLRVDAPVSFDVGLTMDGAEFDEDLRSGLIRRGDLNHIYVHVHRTPVMPVSMTCGSSSTSPRSITPGMRPTSTGISGATSRTLRSRRMSGSRPVRRR